MSDAQVIELHPDGANNRCECGEEWVKVDIVVDHDGRIVAHGQRGECASCGLVRQLPARKDLS